MPSVSVPLKGERGWGSLVASRKRFWRTGTNDRLTAHFKASEFYTHDGTPCPVKARPAMVKLCKDYLEPLRDQFGACLVLSGYRHEAYNRSIGGARHSQHIYEHDFESVAADLRFQRGNPAQWANAAKQLRTKHGGKGGIGLYVRSGFIHVDNRGYTARLDGLVPDVQGHGEDSTVEWRLKRIEKHVDEIQRTLNSAHLDVLSDRVARVWSLTMWLVGVGVLLLISLISGIAVTIITHLIS